MKLIRANETIKKLQTRCSEKTAQINRLNVSEKRHQLSKKSLQEILRDIKEKKWINDDGQKILHVIRDE